MPKIDIETLPDRQARLKVTVEPERLQQELNAAARRIAGKVNIPGFRKGKAPYHIILRYFGEDTVFSEAIEQLGQAIYRDALNDTGLEPYAPGSLDDVARDPLTLTYTVPLVPHVDLGKYRDIRVKFEPIKVSSEDVESTIDRAREGQATHEHVDRPVALEDVALLDIRGVIRPDRGAGPETASEEQGAENEDLFIDRKATKVLIAKKSTYPVPGFSDQIVGMSAGDTREFDVTISSKNKDIDEELRGRTLQFVVSCSEVFKRDIPELDDDFARSLGDYEDLKDLRQEIRADLEKEAEQKARAIYANEALDLMLEKTIKVSYPPVMVEEQVDEMVQDFDSQIRQQGLNLDDYLLLNKTTLEAVRADFRESAIRQIQRGLALGEISHAEQLTVSDDEIDDETQTRLLSFGAQASAAQALMKSPAMRQSIANRLLTDKTMDRLAQIARGEAPPIADRPQTDKKPAQNKTATGRKKREAKQDKAELAESNIAPTE